MDSNKSEKKNFGWVLMIGNDCNFIYARKKPISVKLNGDSGIVVPWIGRVEKFSQLPFNLTIFFEEEQFSCLRLTIFLEEELSWLPSIDEFLKTFL